MQRQFKHEKRMVGKPDQKVLCKSLGKQRWNDEEQLERCTMDSTTDDDGKVFEGAEEWSLMLLMASGSLDLQRDDSPPT